MEYRPQKLLDINIALCQNCQNKLLLASSYGYFCLVPYYLPADSSTQHTCYLVLLNTTLGPHGGRGASSFLRTVRTAGPGLFTQAQSRPLVHHCSLLNQNHSRLHVSRLWPPSHGRDILSPEWSFFCLPARFLCLVACKRRCAILCTSFHPPAPW